eukprot:scaffold8741_cov39-Isochrysis_galbana.AAC.1
MPPTRIAAGSPEIDRRTARPPCAKSVRVFAFQATGASHGVGGSDEIIGDPDEMVRDPVEPVPDAAAVGDAAEMVGDPAEIGSATDPPAGGSAPPPLPC